VRSRPTRYYSLCVCVCVCVIHAHMFAGTTISHRQFNGFIYFFFFIFYFAFAAVYGRRPIGAHSVYVVCIEILMIAINIIHTPSGTLMMACTSFVSLYYYHVVYIYRYLSRTGPGSKTCATINNDNNNNNNMMQWYSITRRI